MNNSDKKDESAELWERIKTMYMASLPSQEQKSQVDRYLSMVSRVERDGD